MYDNKNYISSSLSQLFAKRKCIKDYYTIVEELNFHNDDENNKYCNKETFMIISCKIKSSLNHDGNDDDDTNNIITEKTDALYFLKKNNWKLHENKILNELTILKKIKNNGHHTNIINIKDWFFDSYDTQQFCIVLEYAEKGDLYNNIIKKKERLCEKEVLYLFRQIVEGIYYLHLHCIAHLDIKLENIVITKDNIPKICDFNLSIYFEKIDKNNNKESIYFENVHVKKPIGSLGYVAPEILMCAKTKQPYNPFFADVWSCGIVLYTMLLKCFPFNGKTIEKLFQNIQDYQYGKNLKMISLLSEATKNLIFFILQINVQNRPKIWDVKSEIFKLLSN